MKLLTNEQQKSYENAKICYVRKKQINLKYSLPKEISIVFSQWI